MPELPHRNLDTGMGLERMAAILQHKSANYDGDIMQDLIKLGEQISGKSYDPEAYSGPSRSLRIIADHARATDDIDAETVRRTHDKAQAKRDALPEGDHQRAYYENKMAWCDLLLEKAGAQTASE